ncbi:MAG: hypothetical protein HZA36_01955 [Parcubacteria group bacterium]|nr:hypothetical protein [Parcubacteria group bacterium]
MKEFSNINPQEARENLKKQQEEFIVRPEAVVGVVQDPGPFIEEIIEQATGNEKQGGEKKVGDIEKSFNDSTNKDEFRAYHNKEHTPMMMENAVRVLQAYEATTGKKIPKRLFSLVKMYGSHHDIDQSWAKDHFEPELDTTILEKRLRNRGEKIPERWDPKYVGFSKTDVYKDLIMKETGVLEEELGEGGLTLDEYKKIQRTRHTSLIEQNSIGILLGRMEEINEKTKRENGKIVFTKEDMQFAKTAIEATIPGFNGKTITQPKLQELGKALDIVRNQVEQLEGSSVPNKESLLKKARENLEKAELETAVAMSVAWGDLGGMAMKDPETFEREGNRVLLEEQSDLLNDPTKKPEEQEALYEVLSDLNKIDKRLGELSEVRKEYVRTRILGWIMFQQNIINGQEEKVITGWEKISWDENGDEIGRERVPGEVEILFPRGKTDEEEVIRAEKREKFISQLFDFKGSISAAAERAVRVKTMSLRDLLMQLREFLPKM